MLSNAQRALIKATVPLLETGGEALITHFYRTMLGEYPEVRPLFNQAHQASGDQPRALANGVLMYARHIDQLQELGPLVAKVVNKHVSLQVLPEHYPIVGTCLLRAIREVLGEQIATDEVLEAWGAAYQQLADLLIEAEESVYAASAQADGGWRGVRRFRVARKQAESEEITSFYLEPVDGQPLLAFQPGQYIGLRLDIDGEEVRRNYSLSAASNGREYRISVKREAGGRVSNHLHDRVAEGDELDLFPPAGDFVLRDSDKPLVLITAGVGITPALAMLQEALPQARPIHPLRPAWRRACLPRLDRRCVGAARAGRALLLLQRTARRRQSRRRGIAEPRETGRLVAAGARPGRLLPRTPAFHGAGQAPPGRPRRTLAAMPLRVLRSGRRAGRLKRRAGARCVGPFRKRRSR